MAEIQLSVLQRQRLRRRIADRASSTRGVTAWANRRNTAATTIDWQFTTADVRIKLRRLYPAFDG